MTPYTSAEEALAAGWTYDPTATSALRWKVTLQKESETSVSAAIALGQEGGKDAIVFENTYSKFVVPSLPPPAIPARLRFTCCWQPLPCAASCWCAASASGNPRCAMRSRKRIT